MNGIHYVEHSSIDVIIAHERLIEEARISQ